MDFDPTLTPIGSESGSAMRTPVKVVVHPKVGGYSDKVLAGYTICVGTSAYRFFTEDTVPTEIKSLLGMVKAFPEDARINSHTSGIQRYVPPDPRLKDIGWQLSPLKPEWYMKGYEWYMLVVSNVTFESMKLGDGRHT